MAGLTELAGLQGGRGSKHARARGLPLPVRGGGGNFGVVTAFRFRLHPVGAAGAGRAGPVPGRGGRPGAARLPQLGRRRAPPGAGAGLGTSLLDLVMVKPYADHQATFDATVPHGLHYWRSHYPDDLGDGSIGTLADSAWDHGSPWSYAILFQLGGVVRLPEEATAFSGRDAGYALNINAVATDAAGYPSRPPGPRRMWEAMRPHGNGVYVNFLDREGNDRVRAAYGPARYDRLPALKHAWDPGNCSASIRTSRRTDPGQDCG